MSKVPKKASDVRSVNASANSPFGHAIIRIRYLKDPDKLNALFDLFQRDGMPMGSDRWSEYVQTRYLELLEKERTLSKILRSIEEAESAAKNCGSSLHRDQHLRMIREFQEKSLQEEMEAEK